MKLTGTDLLFFPHEVSRSDNLLLRDTITSDVLKVDFTATLHCIRLADVDYLVVLPSKILLTRCNGICSFYFVSENV